MSKTSAGNDRQSGLGFDPNLRMEPPLKLLTNHSGSNTDGLRFGRRRGLTCALLVGVCAFWALGAEQGGCRSIVGVSTVPSSVIGGQNFAIRVTLDDATGNAIAVRFFSHDQAGAPFSAVDGTIPDGSISRDFSFSTRPVASDTVVRYTVFQVVGGVLNQSFARQVTVKTPKVTSFGISAGTVTGGSTVTGTVRLDGPAPATGAKVQLANTQPSAIEVPPEVVVSPGKTQFSFLMVTAPVASSTLAVITAKRSGQNLGLGRTVRVNPPGPVRLDLDPVSGGPQPEPPTVPGGFVVRGHILLGGPAPAGGVSLTLDSNNVAAVSLPAGVFIPAGGSRAEFELTAKSVGSATNVTVRATNTSTGVAVQDSLTVEPATLATLSLFPTVITGGESITADLFLRGIAPSGGVTLTPTVSQPALLRLPLPTTIAVAPGEREGQFSVFTTRVTQPRTLEVAVSMPGQPPVTSELELLPARSGDVEGNGTLDLQDHRALTDCLTGPAVTATSECRAVFGFAPAPGMVDLRDVSGFLNEFTGSLAQTPRVHVVVDDTLEPVIPELLPLDGAGPGARPLACMTDESGNQADFVENELMLIAENAAVLNAFVARWQGEVIDSIELFDPARPDARFCLVRINTDLADTSTLEPKLAAMAKTMSNTDAGEFAVRLRVSSEAARGLLTAATEERLSGLLVGPNWIPLPQGISDRNTSEAPTGPGSYTPNAFCWDYMNSGSVKDIGVTEAWRVLDGSGRLIENSVEIAVVDSGFRITPAIASDLPPNIRVEPDPTRDLSTTQPNRFGCPPCTAAGCCPWHGVNVLSSAMGVPDNTRGSAGPAGPVGRAVIFVPRNGSSRFRDIFTVVKAFLGEAGSGTARIFNFSGSTKVNFIVGALTDILNEIFDLFDVIRDGILIFAAAGNSNQNVDHDVCVLCIPALCGFPPIRPCCPCVVKIEPTKWLPCELKNVTCVGGLGPNGSLTKDTGSNWGNEQVDLWAPFRVWVGPDFANPGVRQVNGTSFASPYAAGVAALVFAANPSLRARDVKNILKDTARTDSPDSRVRRYINAIDAVVDDRTGLPGEPPSICIIAPDDGTPCGLTGAVCPSGPVGPTFALTPPTFSKGSFIYLAAQIADRELGAEFCSEPDVVWTGDFVGASPRGLSASGRIRRVGLHTITASVEDCTGFTASDQVVVNIVNDPPFVELLKPLDGMEFCFGEAIEFTARAFDVNEPPSFGLPASNIEWTSNRKGSVLFRGESGTRPLTTVGTHTITVTARDAEGATATDHVAVTIKGLPCEGILVLLITQPPSDISSCSDPDFGATGFDPVSGQRFADVVLESQAFDVEDGPLSGGSLVWKTDQTSLQSARLGTGTSPTVRLFLRAGFACTLHRVTLTATDSDGNSSTRVRLIRVWTII